MGVPLLLDVLRKPATTLVVALCSFIWFQIQKRAISYPDVGISYDAVVSHRQFWRLASAPLSHISLLHLLFNVSALWSMGGIETLTSADISRVAVMASGGGAAANSTSGQWQSTVSSVPLAPSSPSSSLLSSSFASSSQPASSLDHSIPQSSISSSLTGQSNSSTEPSQPGEFTAAAAALARRGLGENANAGPIQGQQQQNPAEENDQKQQLLLQQQQQQKVDKTGLSANEQQVARGWEPGGSIGYLRDSFLMLVLSGLLGLAMYHVLIHRWRLEYFRRVTAVGYSCVVFGWMTVLSVRRPAITLSVFGLIKLPVSLAPFESLIFTSFIVPKASFVGHLAGIIAGYLLSWGALKGFDTYWTLVLASWFAILCVISLKNSSPVDFSFLQIEPVVPELTEALATSGQVPFLLPPAQHPSLPPIKPYDALFRDPPKPLGVGPNPKVVSTPKGGVYGAVLGILGYYSKESELIRGANALYRAVTRQADDETFLRALGLPSQFRTHHALLVLHTWLALLRLRKEGAQGAAVGQTFYHTFNHDVERRVVAAGVKMLVSKWMRELERSFYGAAAAYDAAVAPGASADALPKALWRNVFAEDASDMPSGPAAAPVQVRGGVRRGGGAVQPLTPSPFCIADYHLQALTRYVRLELASLALTDSEAILTGNITFTNTFHAES
ncbi:unnamed protein product [Closterium sp. NIES-54]